MAKKGRPAGYRANCAAIKAARLRMGLTQADLADRCGFGKDPNTAKRNISNMESEQWFSDGHGFTYDVLSRVEEVLGMAAQSAFYDLAPPKGVPWVAWQQSNLNELANVGKLMGEHLQNAGEMLGYAAFLPCSFETADFTHGHHESIYARRYEYPDEWSPIVAGYNAFGARRRDAVVTAGASRPWVFTHMMFQSDLEKIADVHADEYAKCSIQSRRNCLANLIALLKKKPDWQIRLLIVPKSDESVLRSAFPWNRPHWDSLVMIFGKNGERRFAFWRDDFGKIYNTHLPDALEQPYRWLNEFRRHARMQLAEEVVTLLDNLRKTLAQRKDKNG